MKSNFQIADYPEAIPLARLNTAGLGTLGYVTFAQQGEDVVVGEFVSEGEGHCV